MIFNFKPAAKVSVHGTILLFISASALDWYLFQFSVIFSTFGNFCKDFSLGPLIISHFCGDPTGI